MLEPFASTKDLLTSSDLEDRHYFNLKQHLKFLPTHPQISVVRRSQEAMGGRCSQEATTLEKPGGVSLWPDSGSEITASVAASRADPRGQAEGPAGCSFSPPQLNRKLNGSRSAGGSRRAGLPYFAALIINLCGNKKHYCLLNID